MLELPFKKLHILNYITAALIVITALLLVRHVIGHTASRDNSLLFVSENKNIETVKTAYDIMSYAPIVEKNPFGPNMEFHPIIRDQGMKRKNVTPSELILFGTVTGSKNLSYAILTDKSRQAPARQELFVFGDEVYDYGKLTKIERSFVEITKGAATYKIPIVDIEDMHKKNSPSGHSRQLESRLARKINEKQFILDQRKVRQSLDNPERILSDARLYPNIENGEHEGFRVLEVRNDGIYDELGLKNRDILLKINGLNLTSPQAAMQAMSALKGMSTVNLDIIRNGEKMTLNYQVR
jgi:general secretion pathway protein C